MACPDENALLDFAERRVADALAARIASHLDECDACRRVLALHIHRRGERADARNSRTAL